MASSAWRSDVTEFINVIELERANDTYEVRRLDVEIRQAEARLIGMHRRHTELTIKIVTADAAIEAYNRQVSNGQGT